MIGFSRGLSPRLNKRYLFMLKGFPGGSDGKESACNTEDLGLIPRLPWRRAWQLTPVFLPEESPWTEVPGGLQSIGLQRLGYD